MAIEVNSKLIKLRFEKQIPVVCKNNLNKINEFMEILNPRKIKYIFISLLLKYIILSIKIETVGNSRLNI